MRRISDVRIRIYFFFFQAEDGIRDHCVTGVQTCALPILDHRATAERFRRELLASTLLTVYGHVERVDAPDCAVIHLIADRLVDHSALLEIGRASCMESESLAIFATFLHKKKKIGKSEHSK